MSVRNGVMTLLCALAAGAGFALFVASLDVREASLARSALPFFAWRAREPNARPLPDPPPGRMDRVQR